MKSIILAKSNLRKNKGLSICISLLILISSMFICVSGLLVFDYNKNSQKVAKELNTTQAQIYSQGDSDIIDKNYIDSIIPDTVKEYEYEEVLNTYSKIKFGDGNITTNINIINKDSFNRKLSKIEIIEEDKTIDNNYIYIPYHLHTGGEINIGDTYKIDFPSKTYEFKVKGYINSIYGGSYDMGKYEVLASYEDYNKILNENPTTQAFTIYLNYKENIDIDKESNKIVNKIYIDKEIEAISNNLDETLDSRTFMSMIFFAAFLVISLIVIGIVILMIFNNISNYIRENTKTLGALKAIGYTSKNIKRSLLLQFSILTIIGLILGTIGGYLLMPMISNILISQSGIPYNIELNLTSILITVISIPTIIILITLLTVRKINKVDPIIALRDGIETHNFKKNHIPLDKTKLSLNTSISLKNMYKNIKQNIISFITILFLSFLMVMGMVMYQNFSREPKLSLFTFEIVDGIITVDKDIKAEIVEDLKNDKDIKKFEYVSWYMIYDNDTIPFSTHIIEDASLINNQDACYKGRFPKYDNEIAISGKYAKDKGYKIGDKVEFNVGEKSFSYLITGLIQSTSNQGHETVLLYDGAKKIIDVDKLNPDYYFDSEEKVSTIINKYKDKYGDKILNTTVFEEVIESVMDTFTNISNLMLIMMAIISGSIIILVLYLLMKTLIYNRRYEYGILKALGYKSKDLIIQNIISFMPTIIIGSIIGTTISYYLANPYMGLMMRSFGIMKCTMILPIDLMIITVLFLIITSLLATLLMSLKIKKLEPKNLLVGE